MTRRGSRQVFKTVKFHPLPRDATTARALFAVVLMAGNVTNMPVLSRGLLGERFYLETPSELSAIWTKYGYDDILKDRHQQSVK